MEKNNKTLAHDENFMRPPDEFYPFICWCWLGDITESSIKQQLGELYSKGFREVLIYPGFGMTVPYLSEKYLDLIEFAVKQAAASGMKIWLYDEYNWPSGVAAGMVVREHPEYKMVYLRYVRSSVKSQDKREVAVDLPWGEIICARAVSAEKTGCGRVDLIGMIDEKSRRLTWSAPAGEWEIAIFVKETCRSRLEFTIGESWVEPVNGYVDTLNSEAIAEFIRCTHEKYAERVGGYFGDVIKGIFTDEPCTCRPHSGEKETGWHESVGLALPWSEKLPGFFMRTMKYDLIPRLPDLILDTATAFETRKDYWEVVTTMFEDAYFRQLGDWCREHGFQFFGHSLFEEPLYSMLFYQGDFFRTQRHFNIPGIDNIFGRYGIGEIKGECGAEPIACKLASSTAHQGDRFPGEPSGGAARRVMCEAFAVSPETYTMQDMFHMTDWLAVLGVNMIFTVGYSSLENHNPKYMRLHDIRKYSCGRELNNYNNYAGRLSFMLTKGRHRTNVGMLFPTSAYRSRNNRTFLKEPRWREIEKGFNDLSVTLLRNQLDFDYVFEPCILRGRIERNRILLGESELEVIVIPPVNMLGGEIMKKLEMFNAKGGKVILYDSFNSLKERWISRISSLPELVESLDMQRTIRIKCQGAPVPDLLCHQRTLENREIVFLFNGGGRIWNDVIVTFNFYGRPEIYNLKDGTVNSIDYRLNAGKTCITLSFEPYQSHLIVVTKTDG